MIFSCLLKSMHHQQQRQHQQFQKQLEEKIQLLQHQPFTPAIDLPPEADFLDGSCARGESSATSTPNMSPKASNHSAYSNVSASDVGSGLSTEQEEGEKDDLIFLVGRTDN